MVTPWLALWTALAAQAPDSAIRARYAAALHGFSDSLGAVQASAAAFRADLATASNDLVFARARRLRLHCAAARRAARSLAALLTGSGYSARSRATELRVRHDLAELDDLLLKCERQYDTTVVGANADSLRAWGPFRLTRLEADLRRHAQSVQELQEQTGTR